MMQPTLLFRANAMNALSLSNLQFSWPRQKQPCLVIPDWQIARGATVFLSGDSGSGKSTLLQIIAGVLQPQTGSVSLLGQSLQALSQAKRDAFRANHLGFVFQLFNLLPFLSVLHNVLLPTQFSSSRLQRARADNANGKAKIAALRLLEELGMHGMNERPVSELSVGQQQRVALARALIGKPEIIICDEPTSAIDASQRDAFMRLLLAQVDQSGATLIFVSHDLSLAHYFDETVHLHALNRASNVQQVLA
jgi:putative ABC transport system ATP-binding protein